MLGTDGNEAQIRIVTQAVAKSTADETIKQFAEMYPDYGVARKVEIPASLKLWGTVGVALLTLGISGTAVWVVSSITTMSNTLARIDERQILLAPIQEKRFADLEGRTAILERQQNKQETGHAQAY